MMTGRKLKGRYDEICSNLAARRMKPAFDLLGKLIPESGRGTFGDEYRNLEETYHYMLKYTVEGIRDPERQKVYRRLIVSVFELADKVYESVRSASSTSSEYEKKRFFGNPVITDIAGYLKRLESFYLPGSGSTTGYRSKPGDHQERQTGRPGPRPEKGDAGRQRPGAPAEGHHKEMQRLFYHIWFGDKLTSEEKNTLHKYLIESLLPVHYRSLMVTALSLSLQRFFDQEKFSLLFNAYGSGEPEISQRSLTGLLINLYRYDSRLPFYPEITGRLKILDEDPRFKRNLERIIVQLIRSRETEKLQQRIKDEILPEMIKISPNLKNKISLDSLMEEGRMDDRNPEWEEILKDSPGLLSKMEEFSEMQMKGADVFMGSFSMLKSFPFFSEISNWFMPFFAENPEISGPVESAGEPVRLMIEAIDRAPLLCNSDKYSFCLSIGRVPKENLEMMSQAMKAETEQIEEMKVDEELVDPGRREEFISNQYIQDLYRFYKLFPRKGDFEDIFNWRFDFHNKHALGAILREESSILRNIAEYYFAGNHFTEAAETFGYLLDIEKEGALYQKIAWCYQKRGDFEKALEYYLQADLFEVNQLWNLKKIALCYRNLKQPARALEYYRKAEKADPDDLGNQLSIGHCLLELGQFDEALKCYFKVEYLAPGNEKVWRPIAWCSFLTGKKEQAARYLQKLLDGRPNKHDFINMGHVQWSLGNRKDALDLYRRSISKSAGPEGFTEAEESPADNPGNSAGPEGFTEAEFIEAFEEDLPHLINQGIDGDDVPIMLDQLRYFLAE